MKPSKTAQTPHRIIGQTESIHQSDDGVFCNMSTHYRFYFAVLQTENSHNHIDRKNIILIMYKDDKIAFYNVSHRCGP